MGVLGRWAFSYERGTPVEFSPSPNDVEERRRRREHPSLREISSPAAPFDMFLFFINVWVNSSYLGQLLNGKNDSLYLRSERLFHVHYFGFRSPLARLGVLGALAPSPLPGPVDPLFRALSGRFNGPTS